MTDKTETMKACRPARPSTTQVSNLPEERVDALETARQRAIVLFQAYARGVTLTHGRGEQQLIHDVETFATELADALAHPISRAASTIPAQDALVEAAYREGWRDSENSSNGIAPIQEGESWERSETRAALAKLPAPPVMVEGGQS